MNGLDKIIDEIVSSSNAEANEIIADAKAQSDEIISKKQAELSNFEAAQKAIIDANAAKREKQIVASAQTKAHQTVLRAKQNVITSMLDEAYARFCSLEGEEYLAVVKKLFDGAAKSGEYTLKLCANEPSEVADAIKAMASQKGVDVIVSDECAPGNRGFILCQNGIEENCTFESLFKANKAELVAKACEILF